MESLTVLVLGIEEKVYSGGGNVPPSEAVLG